MRRSAASASLEAPDEAVDDANARLRRAAKAGHRADAARQEARLTELTRALAAVEPAPEDTYERELDRFPVLQPPLVVQQLTSSNRNHMLFASVLEAHFCLKSARQRRQALRETYQPVARRQLRQEIDDFELFVVPASPDAPRRSQALAHATGGKVRLTSRGQRC